MENQCSVLPLENPIKNYKWGSKTAIAELLGVPNEKGEPQAELWMGMHPMAPSAVVLDGEKISLSDIIQRNPEKMLGSKTSKEFSGKLPFLFKILAAGDPLSIQAHPNLEQAKAGYARENEAGIAADAFKRSYKDDNHKPEIICALTPYWAMNGFRGLPDMLKLFEKINISALKPLLDELKKSPDKTGLKKFFSSLMQMGQAEKEKTVLQAVRFAEACKEEDPVYTWIKTLNQYYPGDIGVLSPILLNLVQLQPGEAMYLPAGELHAYLKGVGVELMANSDNVLRGGLTPKHIDIPELLKVLTFHSGDVRILKPVPISGAESVYQAPAKEFRLSVINLEGNGPCSITDNRQASILICTEGSTELTCGKDGIKASLEKGESLFVPASVQVYSLSGKGTVYKAAVPD